MLKERARNKYRELSQERKYKESVEEIGIEICLKKRNKQKLNKYKKKIMMRKKAIAVDEIMLS